MTESTLVLAAICGALLASAPIFVIAGRRGAPLRLIDALAGLSGSIRQEYVADPASEDGPLAIVEPSRYRAGLPVTWSPRRLSWRWAEWRCPSSPGSSQRYGVAPSR